jgi:hypothetical protein
MAKRNWDVIVVVPGRENNDGSVTPSTYFSGKREDDSHGGRKLVGMKQTEKPVLINRKTGKRT